jgi:hypothetical protein
LVKKRLYVKTEELEACHYCPANISDYWSDESRCDKTGKFFKGMYMKNFPKWCPLKEVEDKK